MSLGYRGYLNKFSLCVPLVMAVVLSTTGCFSNNGSSASSSSGTKTAAKNSGSLPVGGTTDAGYAITLTRAVRSNQDPTTTIELIGSGGEIGRNCTTLDACVCQFSWVETGGNVAAGEGIPAQADQEPSYAETDMVRCLFTQVSSNATKFNVSLRIKAASQNSNTLTVFMPSQNPGSDPSVNANYLAAERYQCRDLFTKQQNTNFYTSNLLDPRLWDDMSLTYDFYTTSFGLDYGATAAVSAQGGSAIAVPGWECPSLPNDINFDPNIFDLKLTSAAPLDLDDLDRTNVPATEGDSTIFPSDDHKDANSASCPDPKTSASCEKYKANRHDFYLANFMGSVFKQPVCVIHKVSNFFSGQLDCNVDTSKGPAILGSPAVGADIIGFAAFPNANQECPTTQQVTIPSGKKWAKLWQFRASISKRSIQQFSDSSLVGDLFCTNRQNECTDNFDYLYGNGNGGVNPGNGGGNTNTMTDSSNSVCWNVPKAKRKGASSGTVKVGPQVSAVLFTGGPGFGNCSTDVAPGGGVTNPGNNVGFEGWLIDGAVASTGNCNSHGAYGHCCTDDGSKATNSNPANFTANGDYCNPALAGSHDASTAGGLAQDVWLMGNGTNRFCLEADTDSAGRLFSLATTWSGDSLSTFLNARELDAESKFDIVYVVTPTSVKLENMQDPNDVIAKKYRPLRKIRGQTVAYDLKSNTENNDDPNARLSQYPLCVLQDTK